MSKLSANLGKFSANNTKLSANMASVSVELQAFRGFCRTTPVTEADLSLAGELPSAWKQALEPFQQQWLPLAMEILNIRRLKTILIRLLNSSSNSFVLIKIIRRNTVKKIFFLCNVTCKKYSALYFFLVHSTR